MDYPSLPSIESLISFWDVPEPFQYSGLKHHKVVSDCLIKALKEKSVSEDEVLRILLKTGNCTIDFYFGQLMPINIADEIKDKLCGMDLWDPAPLLKYLRTMKGQFLNIDVSDSSTWTIIHGRDATRYIHFHPARGSKFTIRVRAITLRTAIFLLAYDSELSHYGLTEAVNRVRIGILSESPIKDLSNTRGIGRLLKVF